MFNFTQRIRQFQPGHQVLLGSHHGDYRLGTNARISKFLVATVESDDGKTLKLRDELGAERIMEPLDLWSGTRVEKGSGCAILWSQPLPSGTPEAVRAFCQVFLDEGLPALFHVTSVEEGRIMGRVVSDRITIGVDQADEAAEMVGTIDPRVHYEVVNGLSVSKEVYEIKLSDAGQHSYRMQRPTPSGRAPTAGTLIAARHVSASISEDGTKTWNAILSEIVGEFEDMEAIAAFLPPRSHDVLEWGAARADEERFGFAAALQREMELAAHATMPNEALALVHPDSDAVALLGRSGALLYSWDDAADYFPSQAPGPGLYALSELRGWSDRSYEGEYDAGIDATWTPATLEDVARWGLTVAAADREIWEYVENDDPEDGSTLRQIELAQAAVEAKNAIVARI